MACDCNQAPLRCLLPAAGVFLRRTITSAMRRNQKVDIMRDINSQTFQVPQMADVVEVNDLAELEQYRLVWDMLFPQTPRASFFHTFQWFQTYWKHFGDDKRMRVLIVRSEGTPIGIVPLCVLSEKHHAGNLRVLTYPLSDWGMWYGPIGPNPSASMFMAMQHLHDTRRDWDLLELRWTDAQPGGDCATGRAMQAVGWAPQKSAYQEMSVIRLAGLDWESYLASRSKKWRHEIRRQTRVLEQSAELTYHRHRPASAAEGDGDPCWEMYKDCLYVSEQSWQSESTTGNTICHEQVRDFLIDVHREAARLGMLDMAVLKLGGKPVAFQYNYHFDRNVVGLRMGFDRSFSKQGVGKVLMSRSIEDSLRRGDQTYDMGPGSYDFKRRFRTDVETSYCFSHVPWLAWRSQGVRLSRWLKRHVLSARAAGKETSPQPSTELV